jgi:hypothetical protein
VPPPARAGGPAPATPRKSNTRLILLLAALVGIVIGGAIGVLAFTRKGPTTTASATPTSAPVNIIGVVSFTASGGLQGNLSISLPKGAAAASSIQKGASARVLEVVVNDASMDFELGLSPYPGPGTYTLLPFQTNPAPGSFNGTVRISNHQSTWSLHPPAQCKVTISSDTPLNKQAQGKPLDEVKGSFTCPTLATDAGSARALKITQGQFDVYALVLGA